METIINLKEDDQNLKRITERYGKTHKIEAVLGTKITLATLQANQSVVYGDGKHYHFRLTKF